MTHETRVARLVETLRSKTNPEWNTHKVPRIGTIAVSCMPVEMAASSGCNECWVRLGSRDDYLDEFRGSAEVVASKLVQKYLKSPSKAVSQVATKVEGAALNGFKFYELAAMIGCEDEDTLQALEYLEERGAVINKGDLGWFKKD